MSAQTENYDLPIPDDNVAAGQSGYEALLAVRNALIAIDGLLSAQAAAIAGKAAVSHGHPMAAIDGLVVALAGKMAADATFSLAGLSDVDVTSIALNYLLAWDGTKFVSRSPQAAIGSHNHLMSEVHGLEQAISDAIDGLMGAAPGALDTLKELADALGNDASFATTVTNALAAKFDKAGGALTGPLDLTKGAAPADPATGHLRLYAKSDDKVAFRTADGTERVLGATGDLEAISEIEAKAGSATTERSWSSERVRQAAQAASPVGLYTGSVSTETSFPIGHQVLIQIGEPPERNQLVEPRISSFNSSHYTLETHGTGAVLSGVWRLRSHTNGGASLVQRVA